MLQPESSLFNIYDKTDGNIITDGGQIQFQGTLMVFGIGSAEM